MTVDEYNISVDKYADAIFRFILRNIKDKERAKDIVQDTFEKMWVKIGSVDFLKAKSYLFTAAYHTMIDIIRKDKKQLYFESVPIETYSYKEQYSDLNEILHKAIERLPTDQRSVVLLRDYEGYSYKEIADITGLSESQVKVYIYRARSFLKNYLGTIESVL